MTILAFDLGGTRTRVGLFDSHLNLVQRLEMTSNAADGPEVVIGRMTALGRLLVKRQIEVIGVSAPGPLDAQSGVIHHAWTLPGWKQVPIAQRLAEAFGVRVYIENDANCGALAEYHAGAGQGCDPMIYLTISTGIGGGVILGGRLFTGWRGLAAEPGHQVFRLADGRVKKLEELASGQGIAQIAQERLHSWTGETQLRQMPMLDAKAINLAAQHGDALAAVIIQEAGEWLGLGIVNLLHLFNPQAVVIGGSLTLIGDRLFEPVRAALDTHLLSPAFNAPDLLRPAALGDDVCLFGAAWMAAQRLKG